MSEWRSILAWMRGMSRRIAKSCLPERTFAIRRTLMGQTSAQRRSIVIESMLSGRRSRQAAKSSPAGRTVRLTFPLADSNNRQNRQPVIYVQSLAVGNLKAA